MAVQPIPKPAVQFAPGVQYACEECGGEVMLQGRARWDGSGYALVRASMATAHCMRCDYQVNLVLAPPKNKASGVGSQNSAGWDDLEDM